MHEWALAEAVVTSVVKAAEAGGLKKITRVRIRMGELQQIEPEVFQFVVKEVSQPQTPLLKQATIEFETEPAVLKCRVCNHEWPFGEAVKGLSEEQAEAIHFIPEVAHVYLRCPRCDSPDFEFVKGRGVWVESVEGA